MIVVGEASPILAERWMLAGRLPHLKRIADSGVHCRLTSTLPLEPIVQYCNMLTGKGSGKHGKFANDWQRSPGGGFEICPPSLLKQPFIWEVLSDQNRETILLEVPVAYPSKDLEGCILHFRRSARASSPREVHDELTRRFGTPLAVPLGRLEKRQFVPEVESQMRGETDIATALVKERVWDFMMLDFAGLNTAQHYFWDAMEDGENRAAGGDVIRRVFEIVDEQIGRLLDAVGPETTVFVVSQCGAGALRQGIQLNAWLRRQGFQQRDLWRSAKRRAIKTLFAAFPRRHLPGSLNRLFSKTIAKTSDRIRTQLRAPDFEWSRTRAFAMGEDGHVYINLRDRDPEGIVPGDDYEALRGELIQQLTELEDPSNGEKAVARVYRGEELFTGPLADRRPDLVIEWRDEAYMLIEVEQGNQVFTQRYPLGLGRPLTGGHTREGLLMACGPGIKPGAIKKAGIFDLFPTWLTLLGVPHPEGLDGRQLEIE